jgi:16S rRNA (cytosine1402-N4)-methyltransferase
MHTPVLSEEVVTFLNPAPGMLVVDATLNGGGHARLLAARGARVLGIEWDPMIAEAFVRDNEDLRGKVEAVNDSYANLERICAKRDIHPDGVLMDLGLSSLHYESSGRGFSFNRPEEPLDMRFNPHTNAVTAGQLVNASEPAVLEGILQEYGEEQFAGQIAAAVAMARRTAPLRTVGELVAVIEGAVPPWYRKRKIHCATKTFQALRMAVNDELGNVREGIRAALAVLKPGGRLLVISFHGGEDKLVRELFKTAVADGLASWVQRATVRPSWNEISGNPRARSAKLKIIQKT